MRDIMENPNLKCAPKEMLANWLAVDYLRRANVDERPSMMEQIRQWRQDVFEEIIKTYPHHAE